MLIPLHECLYKCFHIQESRYLFLRYFARKSSRLFTSTVLLSVFTVTSTLYVLADMPSIWSRFYQTSICVLNYLFSIVEEFFDFAVHRSCSISIVKCLQLAYRIQCGATRRPAHRDKFLLATRSFSDMCVSVLTICSSNVSCGLFSCFSETTF